MTIEPTWSRVDEIGGQRGIGEVSRRIVGKTVLRLAVGYRSSLGAVMSSLRAHIVDAGCSGDRS
jgi:hypothetical protein